MPKLRALLESPPEGGGEPEEDIRALRDYIARIQEELQYILLHLEFDNTGSSFSEDIDSQMPQPYTGTPVMDGVGYSGSSNRWARGNHRHPTDVTRARASDLTAHVGNTANPHGVTKAQVGLGNVANERQYSADNPPPIPTPGEVGAVPITREINGYALSADVTLDYADVGAIPATDKGNAGGVAELDTNGMVPSAQLPSYVDDVLEYASQSAFPATGETGKIYVALDTNRTYRWSGSAYVEISESLALGETSSTAYRGDRGKTAYDHSQVVSGNPHNVTAAEVGLGNVANELQYSASNPPPLPTPSDIGAQDSITASGILKGDGNGGVSAAVAGTDYQTPLTAGTDYQTPLAAGTDYQTPLTAGTDYQTPLTAGTDYATPGMIPSVPAISTSIPQMDGTGAAGSTGETADAGHVHPSDDSKANETELADVESGSTASRAYRAGEYFCRGGQTCRTKTNIAGGASFTLNTNYEVLPGGGLNGLATFIGGVAANGSITLNVPYYAAGLVATARSTTGHRSLAFVTAADISVLVASGSITYSLSGNTLTITNGTANAVTLYIYNFNSAIPITVN